MKNILTILWYYITAGKTAKNQLKMLENSVFTAYDPETKRTVVITLDKVVTATILVKGVTILENNKQPITGYIYLEDEEMKYLWTTDNFSAVLSVIDMEFINEDSIRIGELEFTRVK